MSNFPQGGEFVVNGQRSEGRRLAMPIYLGPLTTYTIHATICGATFQITCGSLEDCEAALYELLAEYLWVTTPRNLLR